MVLIFAAFLKTCYCLLPNANRNWIQRGLRVKGHNEIKIFYW